MGAGIFLITTLLFSFASSQADVALPSSAEDSADALFSKLKSAEPQVCEQDKRPPRKNFLPPDQVPKKIREASKSVVRICACEVSQKNCATFIAVLRPGRFVTTQNVYLSLYQAVAERKKKDPKAECSFIAHVDDKKIPITLKTLKTGIYDRDVPPTPQTQEEDMACFDIPELESTPYLGFNPPEVNQTVYHVGYPNDKNSYGSTPRVSSGKVSKIEGTGGQGNFYGVAGTGGGPVLNENGKIVGMFWGKTGKNEEEVSHFLNARQVFTFIPIPTEKELIEKALQKKAEEEQKKKEKAEADTLP